MVSGASEARPLDDRRKGFQLGKFRPVHYASITKRDTRIIGYSLIDAGGAS
jgi:hypothetical protein